MEFAKEILASNWPEWQIVDRIGEGSFGKVYKILRKDAVGIEQMEALKVIRISSKDNETDMTFGIDDRSFVNEIVSEIKLMSELKGKTNIVSYEDHKVIEDADGMGWTILIRMELLTPLKKYLSDKEISNDEVKKIGVDICKALEECQKRNIVHRDIKPENIFVSKDGDFKLGDFGTARYINETLASMSFKGTLLYMAPEMVKHEKYGIQADIYSLGIFLYKLLNAGKFPLFLQDSKDMTYKEIEALFIRRINGEKLPAPCNADSKLSSIILKACEHDAKKRFASASDFKKALEAPVKQPKEKKQKEPSKKTANAKENKKPKKNKKKKETNRKVNFKAIVAVVLAVAIALGIGSIAFLNRGIDKKYLTGYEETLQNILYENGKIDSALVFDLYDNNVPVVAVTASFYDKVQPETYVMLPIGDKIQTIGFNNSEAIDSEGECYEEIIFIKNSNYIAHRIIGNDYGIHNDARQTIYVLENGEYKVHKDDNEFISTGSNYFSGSERDIIIATMNSILYNCVGKDAEYVSYDKNKVKTDTIEYLNKKLKIDVNKLTVEGAYKFYTQTDEFRNEWLEDPKNEFENPKYVFIDIDKDGINEMIISAGYKNNLWKDAIVYSCDPKTYRVSKSSERTYIYNTIGYSEKNHALLYTHERRNYYYGEDMDYFMTKKDGKFIESGCLSWSIRQGGSTSNFRYCDVDINGELINKKYLGQTCDYIDDKIILEFKNLSDM